MTKYFFPTWAIFGILVGLSLSEAVSAAQHQAQFADINYDVVYVRCPRGKEPVSRNGTKDLLNWNGVNDLWLSATNNVYHQPGCDLVLHDSSMSPPGNPAAEKVLVNCNEDDTSVAVCSVADPNVSFDGRYVIYTKFTDTRTFVAETGIKGIDTAGLQAFMDLDPNGKLDGKLFARWALVGLKPYANPALIFMYDLQTGTETQISPDSNFFAGRAHPGKSTEWTSKIPVMDTGSFFMPDGRIGFTSNREEGFGLFQLFAMDRDGKNMEVLGHRAMRNQLHPVTLMDGRIVYSNFDRMLQRATNNNFSLFEINSDGSAPFIFAGKNDATFWAYHYFTQLSDGDIVVTLYYTQQQTGLGALERFPVDPPGPDFVHRTNRGDEIGDVLTTLPERWIPGTGLVPFARPGQFRLTPQGSAGDTQMRLYDPSEYFTHPTDGRTVTINGRFTHPSAAPENDLLTTYSIGGSSTIDDPIFRESYEATIAVIGKDAGIWLLPLEPNSTRQIGHIADDAQVVVDFPEYHEIMPRAVVSYQDIYGIPHPALNDTLLPTRNDGNQDQRLPAGAPYGLTGAASMFDRETRSLNGTPWNMKDGGGTMSGRTYLNLGASGSELAIFDNDEVFGVRVLMPVPNTPKDLYKGEEKWSGIQQHHLRILGEYPVRKPDSNGVEPNDEQGNPDTSFIVRVPADTPFLMQTIDKRGMALDIETASRSVVRGEQQLCAGCHVHTREGMDPFASRAKTDINEFGDFTGTSAPLFIGEDAGGYPTVASAQLTYADEAGATARRSFAVDWDNNIAAIVQNRCASCHAEGESAQQLTGLRLDSNNRTYELLTKNRYTREDGTVISANFKPGNGLTDIDASGTDRITPHFDCCTPSRWLSVNSARSSMLVWALYGERMDGRDPITGLPPESSGVVVDGGGFEYPEIWPKVGEHLAYVSDMPEAEKRLIARWLDIGAPKLNVHDDMMRPVMTLTPVGSTSVSSILVGLWDDSPLDFSSFRVTANGVDITPQVTGTPNTVDVPLSTTVTEANADSIEITLEIWDKPNRSWSKVRTGVTAANRTRKTVTGRALLRMVGSSVANKAPTFASATITTYEGTQSAGVYAQVSDPDVGDSHFVSIVSQPSNGTAQVIDNKLVYIPDTGFVGDDSFQFSASDLGGLSITGTASVTVLAASGGGNSAPTAASASITTNEDTQSAGVDVQVSDQDVGDTHLISIVSQPSSGSAQVIDNKLVYIPDTGFVGDDSFQFSASDLGGLSITGTASVTVLAASGGGNSAPTAASASITTNEDTQSAGVDVQVSDPDVGDTHLISIVSQPTNGSAQVINNHLVYTPSAGFVGDDSFQFSARDSGGLSVNGTASVKVLSRSPSGGSSSNDSGGGSGSQGPLELLFATALMMMRRWLRILIRSPIQKINRSLNYSGRNLGSEAS